MSENKTTRIEIRITQEEKEKLKNYAEENHTTISKLIRQFLNNILQKEKNNYE